jgi:hypothetical protein
MLQQVLAFVDVGVLYEVVLALGVWSACAVAAAAKKKRCILDSAAYHACCVAYLELEQNQEDAWFVE